MKFKLSKMSAPGWELEFGSMQEASAKLLNCLCKDCEDEAALGSYTCLDDNLLSAVLCTPCGCEYWWEEEE